MSKTYKPKKKKRANTHGFLRRKKTKTGKQVLQKRRRKGRAKLTVSK
jgi:large subunit ribosomal protein L34